MWLLWTQTEKGTRDGQTQLSEPPAPCSFHLWRRWLCLGLIFSGDLRMSAIGLLKLKVVMAVMRLGRSQGLPWSPVWEAINSPSSSEYGRVSAQALNKPPGEPSRALLGFLALTCHESTLSPHTAATCSWFLGTCPSMALQTHRPCRTRVFT